MTIIFTVLLFALNFHARRFVLKVLLFALQVDRLDNYLQQVMQKFGPNSLGIKDDFQGLKS